MDKISLTNHVIRPKLSNPSECWSLMCCTILAWFYLAVLFVRYFQLHSCRFRMINESYLTLKPSHERFLTFPNRKKQRKEKRKEKKKKWQSVNCGLLLSNSFSSTYDIYRYWQLTVVQPITVWASSSKRKRKQLFPVSLFCNDYCQMNFMLPLYPYLFI